MPAKPAKQELRIYERDRIPARERTHGFGQFHAEIVNPAEVDFMLQAVITAGTWADRLKRALFYGKKPPGDSRWSTSSVSLVPEMADLIHAMLGCVTESAEIAEHVRDVLTGAKPLDNVNLLEELGDQTWYIALALRYLESNFGEIFDGNIAKLRKRFPDKFTEAAAINRDLAAERAVLEQGTDLVHQENDGFDVGALAKQVRCFARLQRWWPQGGVRISRAARLGRGRQMSALPLIPLAKGMITMKVAEGRFGIDQRAIRRLITLRKLPSARDGYTIMIRPKDLQKAMADGTQRRAAQ